MTVIELAAEAGVTERTFFRHFPTKEAVLFQDYETQLEWLAEALAQRPPSESLFDAVLASVAAFPHDLEVVRQAATARAELISAERIASHLRVVQSSFAAVLTEFVRDRNPGVANIDLAAEVAGSASGGGSGCGSGELGPQWLPRRPRRAGGRKPGSGSLRVGAADLIKPGRPVASRIRPRARPCRAFRHRVREGDLGDGRDDQGGDRLRSRPSECHQIGYQQGGTGVLRDATKSLRPASVRDCTSSALVAASARHPSR